MGDLLHVSGPHKTLWLLQTLRENALMTKSVKKVLEGIRQVSEGGGKVFTRERHGYVFIRGGAVFVLFSGRYSLVIFFGKDKVDAKNVAQRGESG